MRNSFSQDEVSEIIEKADIKFLVVDEFKNAKYSHSFGSDRYVDIEKARIFCSCKKGQGRPFPGVFNRCPYCHSGLKWTDPYLVSEKKYKEIYDYVSRKESVTSIYHFKYKIQPFYYVEMSDDEQEMLIYRCTGTISLDKENNGVYEFKITHVTRFIPGKSFIGQKINRVRNSQVDPFDALGLNSKTNKRTVVFKGCDNLSDFISKHKQFCKISGISDFLKVTHIRNDSGFLFYLYLYFKYPVVELLLKMQYYTLVVQCYHKVSYGWNVSRIKDSFNALNKIFNTDTTKGSRSLKIPKYIGDYLNSKDCPLDVFISFCDIYELDKSLSKDNFEKIIQSESFKILSLNNSNRLYYLDAITQCMTFGYKFGELLNYLYKQFGRKSLDKFSDYSLYSNLVGYLYDYRHMCDLMEIEADKFPNNLIDVHDKLAASYKEKEDELNNLSIGKVAERYESIAIDLNNNKKSEYLIRLPRCSKDLIAEGQAQHNCVGSYISRVAGYKTVVFFVRTKEEPDSSFVTAEYLGGRVNQLFYKNNRPVSNKDIIDFANDFVKKAARLDATIKSPSL